MALSELLEHWAGAVFPVTIGAGKAGGGTRGHTITVGGHETLPFLFKEGAMPNKPVIAFEISDIRPGDDWPKDLIDAYGATLDDPLDWAQACVEKYHARLLCVRLNGAHPDCGDKKPEEEAAFIAGLLKRVAVPLIITGCGDRSKDNLVLPAISEAAHDERCLIGSALQDNYKTLAGAALADGHIVIAESPIDINIAKQLNILISDIGLPLERIVMNPTIGALGYGLEYAYSIMERARLAALSGDTTLAGPFICFAGGEAWRTKEAGASPHQGILWEALTASTLLQAGADILVMRHPAAIEKVNAHIDTLMAK